MKAIVFAYHTFGVIGLEEIKKAGIIVEFIFSHPDDPKEGNWFKSVSQWAKKENIPISFTDNPNDSFWQNKIASINPDFIFSFFYRKLLSKNILNSVRINSFNLHPSKLPQYRGRAPINWVLVNGETETGITLHEMVEKADAGRIVAQQTIKISFADTAKTLYDKMVPVAKEMLANELPRIKNNKVSYYPQDLNKGSYFGRRKPEDGEINWNKDVKTILDLVRAVTKPYPGAFTNTEFGKLIIWSASIVNSTVKEEVEPGTMVIRNKKLYIRASDAYLLLAEYEFVNFNDHLAIIEKLGEQA